jgi:hypothetical protein
MFILTLNLSVLILLFIKNQCLKSLKFGVLRSLESPSFSTISIHKLLHHHQSGWSFIKRVALALSTKIPDSTSSPCCPVFLHVRILGAILKCTENESQSDTVSIFNLNLVVEWLISSPAKENLLNGWLAELLAVQS